MTTTQLSASLHAIDWGGDFHSQTNLPMPDWQRTSDSLDDYDTRTPDQRTQIVDAPGFDDFEWEIAWRGENI